MYFPLQVDWTGCPDGGAKYNTVKLHFKEGDEFTVKKVEKSSENGKWFFKPDGADYYNKWAPIECTDKGGEGKDITSKRLVHLRSVVNRGGLLFCGCVHRDGCSLQSLFKVPNIRKTA